MLFPKFVPKMHSAGKSPGAFSMSLVRGDSKGVMGSHEYVSFIQTNQNNQLYVKLSQSSHTVILNRSSDGTSYQNYIISLLCFPVPLPSPSFESQQQRPKVYQFYKSTIPLIIMDFNGIIILE